VQPQLPVADAGRRQDEVEPREQEEPQDRAAGEDGDAGGADAEGCAATIRVADDGAGGEAEQRRRSRGQGADQPEQDAPQEIEQHPPVQRRSPAQRLVQRHVALPAHDAGEDRERQDDLGGADGEGGRERARRHRLPGRAARG
jgi:hypothetical protein